MEIKLKSNLLLIRKHSQTQLVTDMIVEDEDEDKTLVTGEVIEGNNSFNKGETVIFGKYALLSLKIKGEEYHIIDEEDVLGTSSYKENV